MAASSSSSSSVSMVPLRIQFNAFRPTIAEFGAIDIMFDKVIEKIDRIEARVLRMEKFSWEVSKFLDRQFSVVVKPTEDKKDI